ncbi:MAG TPA: aldolase/citrate lyase family protein [Prosthecobacter sp.]|nr:aldolase/citrate lyase family protein [Prosthecobacter sp.]
MTPLSLAQLRQPIPSFGTWLGFGSPAIAELAGDSGFDWLLLDLEHGCEGEAALPNQLRALKGGAVPIVRVGAAYMDLIGRALDWGALGIMVPHVNSAEEAAACVQALWYPPQGKRGVSRSCRAAGYGLRPPQGPDEVLKPFFMAQIETIESVACAAEIAAVDGVDVLFIGPADLQFDLRARPGLTGDDYETCLRRVVAAASSAGKASGILLRDPADIGRHLKLGFTHVAIDSDVAIMRRGFQQALQAARG